VAPRTPEGRPDLQGNWTNETLTPVQRPRGLPKSLTKAQVDSLEKIRSDSIETLSKDSDPNRPAPPKGGDGSKGAAGNVGGYNYLWLDAGNNIAIVNGEYRSSLLTVPDDGRIPPMTPAAMREVGAWAAARNKFGEYDNPENRPLAERCIVSFGSNGGPPMLPNSFYNNNYTIVQTKDHIMILTEMVHDVRIIYMNDVPPPPKQLRSWMGFSKGRWEGDTLVVETTHIHPEQRPGLFVGLGGAFGATDNMKVTERFHRADEQVMLYRFLVEDPSVYTKPWGGEVPFVAMPEPIYEYACHEGNYAMSNVLSGARSQEREAAAKSAKSAKSPKKPASPKPSR
jgi:hypothetical protein